MGKKQETLEYDYKLVDQYNRIRESENGPYAYKHIKKKKTITKENDYELWLELQAMNCIYIIYKDEIENEEDVKKGLFSKNKKNNFSIPLEDYNGITSKGTRILDDDINVYADINDEMDDICQENNISEKDKVRVKELYPYLYAYILLLNTDDIDEKELENIISKFSSVAPIEEKEEDLVVQSSKSVVTEEQPIKEENIEEIKQEVEEKQQVEEVDIIFDNDYFNYRNGKYEGQEEGDYVYSNKLTGDLICRENDNNLWLELQAMNFINKLFKYEIKELRELNSEFNQKELRHAFKVPNKEKVIAMKLYTNSVDEKELEDYLYKLCVNNNVKENGIEKVFELYPYFCAYIWQKCYDISTTKALVEMKNLPRLLYVQKFEDGKLNIQEEKPLIEEVKEEKLEVEFDNIYYNYKPAILEEEQTYIYCDKDIYVSELNSKELWLKLQAMNFVKKVYKLDSSIEKFVLPEDLYINVLTAYVNDDKIDDTKLKSICEISGLTEKEMKKVFELYPYFCAYIIGKQNNITIEESLNIASKVEKMLNNEENSFQGQENTVVLNMPKNNEIIDKFLNRLGQ